MTESLRIINARLLDGNGGEPEPNSTIVIADGRITDIDHGGSPSSDKAVVDARGRTVMPGMLDLHVHLNNTDRVHRAARLLEKFLASGFTTIGNVVSRPHLIVMLRDSIEKGELPRCSRVIAGTAVVPTNGHVPGRTADGPWEVRKAVRECVEIGVDFIKTAASGGFWGEHEECWWPNYTAEELSALIEEIDSVGKQAVVHVHTQPGLNRVIAARAHQIHHGGFADAEAVQGMKDHDLFFVPTLRVTSEKNIAAHEAGPRPWNARKMRESHDLHRQAVSLAHQLGVRIGLGTDMPGVAPWDAGQSAFEMTELVDCGFSPMEAIQAATRNSAVGAGRGDDLGTLEVGKIADLVIVDGEPDQDVAILQDPQAIRQVVKDGRLIIDRDTGTFGSDPLGELP